MLNEDKIKLMTKMAMYADSPEGKEAIEASKFFKHDYLARKIIWTEICVTLAYIFMIFIFAILKMETMVTDIADMNLTSIVVILVVVYIALLFVSFVFSYNFYGKKYIKYRQSSAEYSASLKKLNNYYKSESEIKDDDVFTV